MNIPHKTFTWISHCLNLAQKFTSWQQQKFVLYFVRMLLLILACNYQNCICLWHLYSAHNVSKTRALYKTVTDSYRTVYFDHLDYFRPHLTLSRDHKPLEPYHPSRRDSLQQNSNFMQENVSAVLYNEQSADAKTEMELRVHKAFHCIC